MYETDGTSPAELRTERSILNKIKLKRHLFVKQTCKLHQMRPAFLAPLMMHVWHYY